MGATPAELAAKEAWQFLLGVFALGLPPTSADTEPAVLRVYTEEQSALREDEAGGAAGTAGAVRDAGEAAQQHGGADQHLEGIWSGNFVSEASEVLARVLCVQGREFWQKKTAQHSSRAKRVVELGAGVRKL